MATPENLLSNAALRAELAAVQTKLERADENENTIERFFMRDRLLELQDEVLYEIEASTPPDEHP